MYDALVVGLGFGGLAAGLRLAEQKASVILCEALKYPGGCASTFEKKGLRFEAGATLFSGFAHNQLFDRWCKAHELDISFAPLEPTVLFRLPGREIIISPNREETIAQFCALPEAPQSAIKAFFAYQKKIADVLWPVFDDPHRLPPFSFSGLWWHLCRFWKYLSLAPLVNTSLASLLKKFELDKFSPFVHYCNALCQITIQTNIHHAEAPFALCTMDYLFRGTGHIKGGIGQLTTAITHRIEQLGGEIRMPCRVKNLNHQGNVWHAQLRKEHIQSRAVIANLLPSGLEQLTHKSLPRPEQNIQKRVEAGWGAVMLYLIINNHEDLPQHPHHYQCVIDPEAPFVEGNHIFCSLGDPQGRFRTATVSTHISIEHHRSAQDISVFINDIQLKMKRALDLHIPELMTHVTEILPASPRTFARFTARKEGCVGGIPRRKGWSNYTGLWPKQVHPNLWLVGDSVFPGQSTLSTAVGGYRTANALSRRLK